MGGGDEVNSVDGDVDSKIMLVLPVSGLEFWKVVFVRICSTTMNTN